MEKMSVAEIAALKDAAVKEKHLHHEILSEIKRISNVHIGGDYLPNGLPPKRQMEIVSRGNQVEILELLKAYAHLRGSSHDEDAFNAVNVCEDAQVYIYTQGHGFDSIRSFMLDNNRLCLKVEKLLIDRWAISSWLENHRFSHKAEKYLIQKCLDAETEEKLMPVLAHLEDYLERYALHPEAQTLLVNTMRVVMDNQTEEKVVESCYKTLKNYIYRYKTLSVDAQKELLALGESDLIMLYIMFSKDGLEVEEELCARGVRKEIEAYFKRYATL